MSMFSWGFCTRVGLVLALAAGLSGPARADDPGSPTPATQLQAVAQAQKSEPSEKPASKGMPSLMTLVPDLTPVSDYRGDLWNRAALFGDAFGKRQELYEKGIALDFMLTQVPQGVVSGGEDTVWKYGASADYYLFLDSGRLDLWPGGLLGIHAETKFGRSLNLASGAISPVNADYLWPSPGQKDETFLSEYYLYQGLAENLAMVLGRLNWVGVADRNRFANNERTQFLNMSLRNTALLGALFPLTAHGVALAYQPFPNVEVTTFAVSDNDEPGVYGSPGGLFSEVSAGAEVDISWKLSDLPGAVRPGFAYGTEDPVALDNGHLVLDKLLGLSIPRKNSNWIVNFNFEQYIYMPEHQPPEINLEFFGHDRLPLQDAGPRTADFDFNPEGVGVFFRFAYTPEDRNPWNMFVSGGVGGRGVIPGRPNDRYGLGFYSLIVSGDLRNQLILGRLDTEWGMEVFYNIAITPWLQLTPDLQYIQSGRPRVDDAVVLGFRVQTYF